MEFKMTRRLVQAIVISTLGTTAPVFAQGNFIRGSLETPNGSETCNPCVENVIEAVNTLRDHGTTAGFNWGVDYPVVEGAGTNSHWQGVQRMPNFDLDFPYLVISSSHRGLFQARARADASAAGTAHLAVVEMASRLNNVGRRLRSNRLETGVLTRFVPPDPLDRIVTAQAISFDFDHPGGMQTIGKYLLVGADGNIGHNRDVSAITLWDMSDPFSPLSLWSDPAWELPIRNANSVGITRLEDERFLMVRALSDAKDLEFYILAEDLTQNPVFYENGELWDRWNYTELESDLYNTDSTLDKKWSDLGNILGDIGYQNTNLVTECGSGDIYLLASHGRRPQLPGGDDFVDAFRVDVPADKPDADGAGVVITKVAKRHMFPSGNAVSRQGDLQAAGGAYISPDHKLYYYATEHGRTGDGGFVKMIEFAPAEAHVEVRFIDDAWVELYDNKNFDGRSIILDYADRSLRDYSNFDNIEQFDDLASSAIYSIPSGHRLRLYAERNGAGGYVDLIGSGTVERLSDFGAFELNSTESANNAISSASWLANITTAETEEIGAADIPASFELHQNYPNPFNPETTIDYEIKQPASVRIAIYDIKGHLIEVLVDGQHSAGAYEVRWDGTDGLGNRVASGTYVYRLEVEEFVQTRKLTLLR